jgi:hypothetical protein
VIGDAGLRGPATPQREVFQDESDEVMTLDREKRID